MVRVRLSEPFTKDQLLLATLFYPQVLVHQCLPPYNTIEFDRNVHQATIDIIDILGLDPKVVTFEDMCLDCVREGRL